MSAPASGTDPLTQLRVWVRTGDEAAFTAVVTAYSGLVFNTARQCLGGDAGGAGEVTQNVFLTAARKAPQLIKLEGLSAWFHSTAMKESANHRRGEERRRNRLQKYASLEMADPPVTTAPTPGDRDADAVREQLNEALAALKPAEREILLSRFFENLPFAVIAEAQRTSPDAVRMKCRRALEKLSAWLSRRGLSAGNFALIPALTSQWSGPAPDHLTASIVSAIRIQAAAAATAASTPTLSLMASAKFLTGTVLLLGLVPLYLQNQRLRELRKIPPVELHESVPAHRTNSTVPRGGLGYVPLVSPVGDSVLALPVTAEGLAKLWMSGRGKLSAWRGLEVPGTILKNKEAVYDLSVEELRTLISDVDGLRAGEDIKTEMRAFLVQYCLAGKDLPLAMEMALKLGLKDHILGGIAQEWAGKDSHAAREWLEKRREGDVLAPVRFGEDPEWKLWTAITRAEAEKDPEAAVDRVVALMQTIEAPALLRGLAPVMAKEPWQDRYLDLAARLGSPEAVFHARVDLLAQALQTFDNTDEAWKDARLILENAKIPPEQRETLLLQTLEARAAGDFGSKNFLFGQAWSLSPPERRREVLLKLMKSHEPKVFLSSAAAEMATHENALAEMARAMASADPARSRRYAEGIVSNHALRQSLETELGTYPKQP